LEQLETRLALCAAHAIDDLIDPAVVIDGYGVQTLSGMGVPAANPAESFAVSLATSTGTLSTLGGDFVATATGGPNRDLPRLRRRRIQRRLRRRR
jgi:hypothetical protein